MVKSANGKDMKRLFSLILAFFCAQFILGAVTYKSTDVKAGDYVVWDAQRRIFKAIDGGFRGAPAATRNWTIEDVKIPADMVDKIVGVVMYVFRGGDEKPGQAKIVRKKDGDSYAGTKYSGSMGNYMIYERLFTIYNESPLRDVPLTGIYSQDGSTCRHAYVLFLDKSDRKWVYSSDKDNVGPKIDYKIGNNTKSTYIRDSKSETDWVYGQQYKDFKKYLVGMNGYELKFAVTQYNERRGVSHRIKPNHWALECDRIRPFAGATTSSWMVPTKNEIMMMSCFEKPVNNALKRLRLAGRKDCREITVDERYWTIEEHSKDKAYCWYLNEADVIIVQPLEKTKERYVRTIIAL